MDLLSRMPKSFNSGIAREMTQTEIELDLRDDGIEVIDGEDWNAKTRSNTPGSYKLPDAIQPLNQFIEIKGQEIHSSCFGAALTALAERNYFASSGKIKRFCVWPTYMLAQMYTGRDLYGTDGGTVPSHGIKVAANDGFLTREMALKHLDPGIVRKWGGDVYPRNYWQGKGSFERIAQQAYEEACRAYEPLLKNTAIREAMKEYRMPSIVRFKSSEQEVEAEQRQSAMALECHVWTPDCDNQPKSIDSFSGVSKGGQHGHHATYICGLNRQGQLLKANSWRPVELLKRAAESGNQELASKEWGDDGIKAWNMNSAHPRMARHEASYIYGFSNMPYTKASSRHVEIDTNDIL